MSSALDHDAPTLITPGRQNTAGPCVPWGFVYSSYLALLPSQELFEDKMPVFHAFPQTAHDKVWQSGQLRQGSSRRPGIRKERDRVLGPFVAELWSLPS